VWLVSMEEAVSETLEKDPDVDAFKEVFAVPTANAAETKAEKAAKDAIAQLRKLAAQAVELAAKQDPKAKLANPLDDYGDAAHKLDARLGPVATGATAKTRTKAYQVIAKDAKDAAGRAATAIDAARKALARAEKVSIDKMNPGDQTARLKALAADGGGRQIIDGMVAGFDGKAKGAAAKTFVGEALKARFDVELSGDMLTTKALPRIYELMARVPDSHTVGNANLKKINREQNIMPAVSDFSGGTINLRCGRAGALGVGLNPMKNIDGIGLVNHFDHTTLHEVGHSVESKFPFKPFANWQSVVEADIVGIMLNDFGFHDIPGYPKAYLKAYCEALFRKNNVETSPPLKKIWADGQAAKTSGVTRGELLADTGVTNIVAARAIIDESARRAALRGISQKGPASGLSGGKRTVSAAVCAAMLKDPALSDAQAVDQTLAELIPAAVMPAQPDWRALQKHPGVAWYHAVALQGEHKGLWGKGGGVSSFARNGTVYQESTPNDWSSYDLAARADAVSNYQFRAASEWFAELYGVYYLGKLPKTHKHYDWFKNTVDK
jgi:hypothetical protein